MSKWQDIICVIRGQLSSDDITDKKLCEDTIAELNHTIREMDQRIFNMGQKTSWEAMRPIFVELCEETNHRIKIESGRIRTLLATEIQRTYVK